MKITPALFAKGVAPILLTIGIGMMGPIAVGADCIPTPAGLVSWWRAEGNGSDAAGSNPVTLVNGLGFGTGEVGQAFAFDGVSTHARATASATLNVGTNSGFTVEGWINPADVASGRPIVEWYNGVNLGAHFWLCLGSATPGVIGANLVDTAGGYHVINTGGGVITANTLQHIALTYDRTSGIAQLYRNGVIVAQAVLGIFTPQTSQDLLVGHRPSGGYGTGTFSGLIDELSLYNRVLPALEIQAIFNGGAAGKCVGPAAPLLLTQPTNQTVIIGESAAFGVVLLGAAPVTYQWLNFGTNLPAATNATLVIGNAQLGDAGGYQVIVSNPYGAATSSVATLTVNPPPPCVLPPSGLVSWWRGEGNGDDSVGGNGLALSGVTFGSGKSGQALVFDGVSSVAMASASAGLNVGAGAGFTIESWVKPGDVVNSRPIAEWNRQAAGSPPYGTHFWLMYAGAGSFYANIVDTGNTWHVIASDPGVVRSNEFQHLALTYEKATGWARLYHNGVLVKEANVGSFTPQTSYNLFLGRRPSGTAGAGTFLGVMDEVSLYGRALASNEVAAIYAAERSGKCEVQIAPAIMTQPTNRSVLIGGSTTLFAAASGSLPLSYQWWFNDTNAISGATNAALVLTNVQWANGGRYAVAVTNAVGTAISSNAQLTVIFPPANVRIVGNSNALPGTTAALPVQLVANGDENALGFSLNYSASLLAFAGATLGSGVTNASLLYNTAQTNVGRVGLALALSSGQTVAAGTQEMVVVYFNVIAAPAATNRTTTLTFGDAPTARQLVNAFASSLPATYSNAAVVIPAIDLEGDTQPRPGGNRSVTVSDWVQVGRFVARLDTVNDGSEYQRADCAPRATLGNGVLSTTDWVQAGRYAAWLDAPTMAGGPTSETTNIQSGGISIKTKLDRTVRVVSQAALAGTTNTVSIQLDSLGDENALGFSLSFDRAKLQYLGATLGSGAGGASLNFNSNQEASGRLGAVLALGTGTTFAAGTREILKVSFLVLPAAAGNTSLGFGSDPVPKEISDASANVLGSSYASGSLAISAFPPVLRISQVGTNLNLAWPVVASNFVLQASDTVWGAWSNAASPVVVGPDNVVTTPNSGTTFYRLLRP